MPDETVIDTLKAQEAVQSVPVEISVVLGRADLRVHQLLKLGRGAVVELEQKITEPIEIFANGILIAKGEVNIIDGDKIGVTFTEIVRSLAAV
ncbi:FliM/FliN family flagellar motor switch protein [Phaeovibrio sulfidiphilus]|uniref:Flagellar motor switch protein FliN n=1 Tax=Phaeovibrio sulfidiphilus TaxID=1220600 RepID=A0A8J6YQI4_9PROT|nr:FliM/FliN family flagellar motor switch protein [Phaeovibrio sulfidiphilus]MBE1237974.1 FliM/FliN family flagellar motor switch protein [Phaeovibrio sulfidiphilus]